MIGGGMKRGGKARDERKVTFQFSAPEAKSAYVAGEFNNWDTHSLPMKKQKDGKWKAQAKLPPGRYEYKFVVDGKWIENLPGSEQTWNQYGTQNFVIQVV